MSDLHQGLHVRLQQQSPVYLDVELQCAPGELLALIGPSGSGKTTLLRLIAGLSRHARGRVRCNGALWLDSDRGYFVTPQRRHVGFVFQEYALFPHLSAMHNITSALGHLPRARRQARALELLELVHLDGLGERRPHQLSGGQRQRVAVARALAGEPSLLLLDEPFSAVDQATRRRLQRELALLRRRIDVPTVLVTHDLGEATALADRICVMHGGITLQSGTPEELLHRPQSEPVARLVGLQNIYRGSVVEHRRNPALSVLRWRDYLLEVAPIARFPQGAQVSWVIHPSHVYLHRRGRPSRGERENPVCGVVGELVHMGENSLVEMHVDGDAQTPLNFSVSRHAAERNELRTGADLKVSLLARGIHLIASTEHTSDSAKHGP